MTDLPDKLDKILREAIVGENFVSYSDLGQAKADKAKAQINQLLTDARIDELEILRRKDDYLCGLGKNQVVSKTLYRRWIRERIQALKTREEQ